MTRPHADIHKIVPFSYADSENFNKTYRQIDDNLAYLDEKLDHITGVMYVDPAGVVYLNNNLGIGIEDPKESLEVKGNIQVHGDGSKLRFTSDSPNIDDAAAIEFSEGDDATHFRVTYDGNTAGSGSLRFHSPYSKQDNILVVSRTGKVGIGTNSPSQKLSVDGSVAATSFLGDGSKLAGITSLQPVAKITHKSGEYFGNAWGKVADIDIRNIYNDGTLILAFAGEEAPGSAGKISIVLRNGNITEKPNAIAAEALVSDIINLHNRSRLHPQFKIIANPTETDKTIIHYELWMNKKEGYSDYKFFEIAANFKESNTDISYTTSKWQKDEPIGEYLNTYSLSGIATPITKITYNSGEGFGNAWGKVVSFNVSGNFNDGTLMLAFAGEEGLGHTGKVSIALRNNKITENPSAIEAKALVSDVFNFRNQFHYHPRFKIIASKTDESVIHYELWMNKKEGSSNYTFFEIASNFETNIKISYSESKWQEEEPTGELLNIYSLSGVATPIAKIAHNSGENFGNAWGKVVSFDVAGNYNDGTLMLSFAGEEVLGHTGKVSIGLRNSKITEKPSAIEAKALVSDVFNFRNQFHYHPQFKIIASKTDESVIHYELWMNKKEGYSNYTFFEIASNFETNIKISYSESKWQEEEPTGELLNVYSVSGTVFQTLPNSKDAVYNAGNIGIGNTSPSSLLHLSSKEDAQIILDADTDNVGEDHNPSILFRQDGRLEFLKIGVEGNPGSEFSGSLGNTPYIESLHPDYGGLQFATNNTARMTLSKNGNVGIGTTSPSSLLHLSSKNDAQIILDADTDNVGEDHNPSILFRQDGRLEHLKIGVEGNAGTEFTGSQTNTPYIETVHPSYGLQFATDNTARMTISKEGNVGIGTTNPPTKLSLEGGAISVANSQFNYRNNPIGLQVFANSDVPGIKFHRWTGVAKNFHVAYIGQAKKPNVGYGLDFRTNYLNAFGDATTSRMFISPNGNVGIGTTNPTEKLDVNGDLSVKGNINGMPLAPFNSTSSFIVGNNDWSDFVQSGNMTYDAAAGGMKVVDGQWIHIRTRIPIDPLATYRAEVRVKKIDGTGRFYVGADSLSDSFQSIRGDKAHSFNYFCAQNAQIGVGETKTYIGDISGHNDADGTDDHKFDPGAKYFNLVLVVNHGGTGTTIIESLKVERLGDIATDINGNVGIGTNSPSAPLTVASSIDYGGEALRLQTKKEGVHYQFDIKPVNTAAGDISWRFHHKNSLNALDEDIMSFYRGNVGIGVTKPQSKLDIDGSIKTAGHIIAHSVNPGLFLKDTNGLQDEKEVRVHWWENGLEIRSHKDDGSIKKNLMQINHNGNVGIGTTTPQYTLDVKGTIQGENVSPSDKRYKRDIQSLADSLEKVTQLQGVHYRWKDEEKDREKGQQIGLIAQEVESVFPEVVVTDQEGYKSVAYDKLVAPLIEAVKEQQQHIEKQQRVMEKQQQEYEQKIEQLTDIIKEMKQDMANLTQHVNERMK